MFSNDLSEVNRVEVAIHVLIQALQELYDRDCISAQFMAKIARQMLEDMQLDFDQHFQVEERLKQLINQPLH